MYQEPELNVEEKSNASVNKRLYKLLIIILRYTPVVLSINDILHSILSYYNINCYILSCLGGKNYFSSTKFHRAIQKYGWENFTHEILYENLNKEAANKIERDLIKKYDSINNGYNIQEGGYTSLTKESLDKMSKSLKQGYIDHPERKKRISEKLTGRKNSEETKRKKSLNNVRTKLISIDGELGSIRFWAIRIGMSHTALNYRLKTYGEDNLISFIKQKLN